MKKISFTSKSPEKFLIISFGVKMYLKYQR